VRAAQFLLLGILRGLLPMWDGSDFTVGHSARKKTCKGHARIMRELLAFLKKPEKA
jgi:hypothetical protein